MKTKILLLSTLFLALNYVWTAEQAHTNNVSPPVASTGAPGDNGSCARSGCHTGEGTNTGSGTMIINFADGATTFLPNIVYDIELVVMDDMGSKFGFELVALDEGENSIGAFIKGETNTDMSNGNGRQYIHHMNANGNNRFTFQWMSPSEPATDVTFYAAGNAANGNSSRTGDEIYTTHLNINSEIVGVNTPINATPICTISPNPVINNIQIQYSLTHSETVEVQLITIDGRVVKQWQLGKRSNGSHQESLALNDPYCATGLYLLKWRAGTQSALSKVMIQ